MGRYHQYSDSAPFLCGKGKIERTAPVRNIGSGRKKACCCSYRQQEYQVITERQAVIR